MKDARLSLLWFSHGYVLPDGLSFQNVHSEKNENNAHKEKKKSDIEL